jgi:hypothetical protein
VTSALPSGCAAATSTAARERAERRGGPCFAHVGGPHGVVRWRCVLERGEGHPRASKVVRPDSRTGVARRPVPRARRATVDWGRQGEVSYVPEMRTQLVAAQTVAEALADLATSSELEHGGAIPEIAARRRRTRSRRRDCSSPGARGRPEDRSRQRSLRPGPRALPGGRPAPQPHTTLPGPTFEQWFDAAAEEPR